MGRIITQTVRIDTDIEVDIDLDDLDLSEFMADITLQEFFKNERGDLHFVAIEAIQELRALQGKKSNLVKLIEELTGAYV